MPESKTEYVAEVKDIPPMGVDADGMREVPGVGRIPILASAGSERVTRFLGREGGPWVYHAEAPAGDVVPWHKHQANRIEFVVEGRIEWHGANGEVNEYAAPAMSYVEAGIGYSYTVVEAAKILIVFDGPPGINLL